MLSRKSGERPIRYDSLNRECRRDECPRKSLNCLVSLNPRIRDFSIFGSRIRFDLRRTLRPGGRDMGCTRLNTVHALVPHQGRTGHVPRSPLSSRGRADDRQPFGAIRCACPAGLEGRWGRGLPIRFLRVAHATGMTQLAHFVPFLLEPTRPKSCPRWIESVGIGPRSSCRRVAINATPSAYGRSCRG